MATVPEREDAHWWGQSLAFAYPGLSYDPSSKTRQMTAITGRQMYAATLETDHYLLHFIFHDFRYHFLDPDTSISDAAFIKLTDFTFRK
jgi:hypothetical protein